MSQLPLPITPAQALEHVIVPALTELGAKYDSKAARIQVLAIMLQESKLNARHQDGGPAHGLAQFEVGGVRGVLNHSTSQRAARVLCDLHGIAPTVAAVYAALEEDDILAAGFARLLLWTLPAALPAIGDEDEAWTQYLDAWRPGKPRRKDWPGNYATAVKAVQG